MRKILYIITLLPTIGFSQSFTDNLVGHYELNGSGNDLSGMNNNGVLVGGLPSTDRFNNISKALELNGINEYVNLDACLDDLQNTSTGTYSIWVKSKIDLPSDFDVFIAFADQNGNNKIEMDVRSDGKIKCFARTSQQILWMLDTDLAILSTNVWTHLALVQDGVTPVLYVNGEIPSQTISNTINITAWFSDIPDLDNARLGDRNSKSEGEGFFFDGMADDLMIFSRALSQSEIQQLYTDTWQTSSNCPNLFCDGDNVGIGTANTQGYKLAVAGDLIAEKVKVALQNNWPDFVFNEKHVLTSLEETEKFIVQNNHLPEIPSEKEIIKNGINLGEMDAKLLQKIEELTLYIIDMNKQIKSQNNRIEQLEEENLKLKH